jgi:two-component system chemotaxis response regulator CheY
MYRTILLIDDDPDDIEILQDAIASLGQQRIFQTAGSRAQVFELLQHFQTRPDLVFLDLNMPGVIGTELLQKLKSSEATRAIPIVLYSTHPKEVMQQIARPFEPEHYIQKPSVIKNL